MAAKAKAGLPAVEKRRLKQVVRRVHPDRFTAQPAERAQNSESLQVLNAYIADLGAQRRQAATTVSFFVSEDSALRRIEAELPSAGSLGPLFHAFGLISLQELDAGAGAVIPSEHDQRNLLQWLGETVAQAVGAATQHGSVRSSVRDKCAALEQQYGLAAVKVGEEFTASAAQQQQQLHALAAVQHALDRTGYASSQALTGLHMRLYHPDVATLAMADAGHGDASMQSFVGEDGCLHLVADEKALPQALQQLDLQQARMLSQLDSFWSQRCRGLTKELISLLGVEDVWHDHSSVQSSQEFVLWAGRVLEHGEELQAALGGRHFRFSVLVHSDASNSVIEFLPASSTLQVHCICQWQQLLQHLLSTHAAHADVQAAEREQGKEEQETALSAARQALGVSQVISVCSEVDRPFVIAAAQRLCQHADGIAAALDLRGVSLAIDDCYEVWDSGFISIPHSFTVEDLQPRLLGLLSAPPEQQCNSSTHVDAHSAEDAHWHKAAPADRIAACRCLYHKGGLHHASCKGMRKLRGGQAPRVKLLPFCRRPALLCLPSVGRAGHAHCRARCSLVLGRF